MDAPKEFTPKETVVTPITKGCVPGGGDIDVGGTARVDEVPTM